MGFDMRKIVRSFSSDTGLNDALVHRFVCRRLCIWTEYIAIVHVCIYIYVLSIELLKCVCTKYYTFENVYMLLIFHTCTNYKTTELHSLCKL